MKRIHSALAFLFFLTLVLALGTGLSGCSHYDEIVDKEAKCDEQWADLDAQLERRHDLIPNLVAVVKGSAAHEEQTLKEVTTARAEATSVHITAADLDDPAKMAALQKAESNLQGSLSRLLLVQEKYPDLKANAAFHDLQIQIEGTENRILRARELYNAAVRDYNSTLSHVSGMVVNKATGKPFKPRPYFSASAESRAAPTVSF